MTTKPKARPVKIEEKQSPPKFTISGPGVLHANAKDIIGSVEAAEQINALKSILVKPIKAATHKE